MPARSASSTGPRPPPNLLAYIPIDLRIGFGRAWSLAKRCAVISAALLAPLLAYACVSQGSAEDGGGWLIVLLAAVVMDLGYAAAIGLTVATVNLLWRFFGVSMIVAALLAPVAFFGVLALCGPWIAELGAEMLRQWAVAISTSEFASDPLVSLGPLGHAGHAGALILLIILLPYVLIWIGQASLLLITPPVLWSLLSLAAASALVLALSVILAIVVAAPLLVFAMIRRLRSRHRDYIAPAAAPGSPATAQLS